MTIFERLKFLSNKQGKSINRVEQDLNLPKNSLYSWKKAVPSGDRLELIADYFHVSVDYLLGREKIEEPHFSSELLEALDNAEGYSGQPMDDHDKEIIKGLLAGYFAGKNKK